MPRIPDYLLKSVAFLYPSEEAALSMKVAGGSGFLVRLARELGDERLFLVTNQHVIQGCPYAHVFARDSTKVIKLGDFIRHPHGDDVAVAPIDSVTHADLFAIDWRTIALHQTQMSGLNFGVGDDVFMLGRHVSARGPNQLTPVARFGNIAMMPGPLVKDGRHFQVEAFLMEMRSMPGYSGSPVFVYLAPGSFRGDGTTMPLFSETVKLVGVDTGHIERTTMVEVRGPDLQYQPSDEMQVRLNSGVSVVAPIWKVTEALADALGVEIPWGDE